MWFEFNDAKVKEIKMEDIRDAFGNSESEIVSGKGIAYVLMYRLVEDKDKDVKKINNDVIQSYIKEDIESDNNKKN